MQGRNKQREGDKGRANTVMESRRWEAHDGILLFPLHTNHKARDEMVRGRRKEAKEAEVSRFREAEPSVCLFKQKETRDEEADGRKRWPCLLSMSTIMSDDEGETGGGWGTKQRAGEERRGEGQRIEVKEMEGCKAWRSEMFVFSSIDSRINE